MTHIDQVNMRTYSYCTMIWCKEYSNNNKLTGAYLIRYTVYRGDAWSPTRNVLPHCLRDIDNERKDIFCSCVCNNDKIIKLSQSKIKAQAMNKRKTLIWRTCATRFGSTLTPASSTASLLFQLSISFLSFSFQYPPNVYAIFDTVNHMEVGCHV